MKRTGKSSHRNLNDWIDIYATLLLNKLEGPKKPPGHLCPGSHDWDQGQAKVRCESVPSARFSWTACWEKRNTWWSRRVRERPGRPPMCLRKKKNDGDSNVGWGVTAWLEIHHAAVSMLFGVPLTPKSASYLGTGELEQSRRISHQCFPPVKKKEREFGMIRNYRIWTEGSIY